jgi:hypothetical protein
VEIRGASSTFVRAGDSGTTKATFHFCPTCGATVYYTLDADPDVLAIPVGAFADPNFPAPARSVYEERMHSWISLPRNIEHLD